MSCSFFDWIASAGSSTIRDNIQVFDEILKLAHNEINQVKLGITAADLEEIQLTINDEKYQLGELALVTKVKEREIDIDLVEFPDLIDQIYDDVYKIFRDQLIMAKEKNNDKIAFFVFFWVSHHFFSQKLFEQEKLVINTHER